jgi:dipeptidyl-peptidase-4
LAIAKDDSRVAYVKDHQLFVQVGDAAPMQLSQDGSADIVYGGPAHRSEFGIKDGLWWSPEGRFLAFFREDMTPIGIYPYVDHTAMPPKAIHGRYPMAGQIHSAVRVGVYDTQNGELHYLQHGTEPDVYWTNVTFDPSGTALYVAIVNRGQDTMELVGFDAATGKHQGVLFTESDPQWIEPEHGPIFVGNRADRFLWFSPRDGYRHLYLYTRKGELVRQVTTGKFDVHEFLTFDPGAAHAFCMASGSNPLQMHLWRAKLADGSMQQLTKARGWHTCQVRDGGDLVVDSVSNLDLPGQQQVIDIATGNTANVVRIGHRFPVLGKQEFFEVAAEDGTPLHGMLILPPELDRAAARKYPALLYVYGGPHSHLVRDRFLGGSSPWLHWMATQGYVVCTLDNRGTENRGIEFAQSIHRRLAQLETRDQLAAIDHLAGLPYVDTERIGVHGWSYGGYMTLNLMLRAPGRFKCGVAGAPVTDWRQYETGYTERYLDTPQENPEGYQAASVLPLVGDLRDRLLIIHGTDDKTVMWSHTLAFVNQCIGAGTLVDYMPYPMQQHGIRGIGPRLHLYRLMTRHFADHLQPGR